MSYPLFRLTVALAIGIFLSDTFWNDISILPVLKGVFIFLTIVACGLYALSIYRYRMLFGLVVFACFSVFGSILYLYNRSLIVYDWSDEEQIYIGRLTENPVPKKKTMKAVVEVTQVKTGDTLPEWKAVNRKIILYWMPDTTQQPLTYGDEICFRAQISRPVSDADFTGFDYGRYLENKGISGTAIAFIGNWTSIGKSDVYSFRERAVLVRDRIVDIYRSWGLEKDAFAVLSALTIGDTKGLTQELRDAYNAAGTSHVLSLSGLHIGIIAMIISLFLLPLRYLKGGRWLISGCAMVLLWGFAFFSGLSASVIRAVLMFSIYIVASVFTESRFSGFSSLSFAAFLMLLYQPLYLFDVSFQLSYVAVLSILLFYPLIVRKVQVKSRWLRYVISALALSLSAQLGTLPFILHYFGVFPTYFLIANLIVTPLSTFILFMAMVSLCLSWIPILGTWIIVSLNFSLQMLNGIMEWIQQWSGSQVSSVYLTSLQAFLLVVFILFFWAYCFNKSVRGLLVSLLSLDVLFMSCLYEYKRQNCDYLFFTRAGIYTKRSREIVQHSTSSNIFKIKNLQIVLLNDDRWKNKTSDKPLHVDYAYICKGYRGTIKDLNNVFRLQQIIFDSSMNATYKSRLVEECIRLDIPYIDMSSKGSYGVLL